MTGDPENVPQEGEQGWRERRPDFGLLASAYAGDIAGVDTALSLGADVNTVHEATGLGALHIAVGIGNIALARFLIEERNASFGPDREGRWPSLIAAECQVSDELGDYIVKKEAECLSRKPA